MLLRVLRPRLHGGWFRVRPAERRWHARAGVPYYRRLLRAAGWDAVVARARGFDGTRAGLPELDRHTRLSEASHLLGGVVALLLLGADGRGALLAAVLHVHPVLLQRSLRARIAALSAASGTLPGRRGAVDAPHGRGTADPPGLSS